MRIHRTRLFSPAVTLAAVTLAVVLAAGCTSNSATTNANVSDSNATAVLGIAYPVTDLDCALINDSNLFPYCYAVYDTLFQLDPKGNVIPDVALSDTVSPNGMTHTLALRHDVKFQNGTPLTSADVAFSLVRTMTIPNGVNGSYLSNVGTVDTDGPYTVIIHMKRPDPVLDRDLAYDGGFLFPKAYIQKVGNAGFNKHPIGSGPYEVVYQVPGGDVRLKAWAGYWGPKPNIKNIIFRGVSDPSAAAAQLEAGGLDYVWSLDPSQVPSVKAAGDTVHVVNTQNKIFLQFNFKRDPRFDNVLVRQAFNYAVNKEAVVKAIYPGADISIDATLDSPYRPGYDSAIQPYPYDPAKAKRLLEEAHFDFSEPVQLAYPNGAWVGAADAVQAIVAEFANIGIHMTVVEQTAETAANQANDMTFPPLAMENVVNDQYDNLSGIAPIYLCNEGLPWNCSAYTDALLYRDLALSGPARVAATNAFDIYVHDNPPGIFLWDLPNYVGVGKNVTWTPTQTVSYFKVTDIHWKK
jgi:peptide/nickel transport system substrate-binding protein